MDGLIVETLFASTRDFDLFEKLSNYKFIPSRCALSFQAKGIHLRLGEASWRRFRRYFRLIGPWSRLIRRSVLKRLERRL